MIKVFIDHKIMQSILSGLVDQLKSKIDLNLNYVNKRCKEKYGIGKIEGVEYKDGKIVIYKDQIACKLNYEARFPMSVLITTKKNINSTASQSNDIRSELDDLLEEVAPIPEELDDFLEEDDDIPPELDDFLEEDDDIPPELDIDDLESEQDLIDDEIIGQPRMSRFKKKM
jgi:hypothetical protein